MSIREERLGSCEPEADAARELEGDAARELEGDAARELEGESSESERVRRREGKQAGGREGRKKGKRREIGLGWMLREGESNTCGCGLGVMTKRANLQKDVRRAPACPGAGPRWV